MKKIALILGILSSVAVLAGDHSATMKINAEIIRPLNIKSNGDIELGTLTIGEYKTAESSFEIEGESGAGVLVTIERNNVLTHKNNQSITIDYSLEYGDLQRRLDSNGLNTLPMKVHITVPSNQAAGVYEGEIVASIRYN